MRIDRVFIRDLEPFATHCLVFPPKAEGSAIGEVQILTGQNGTGKTRLLAMIAAVLGNDADLTKRGVTNDSTYVVAEHNGLVTFGNAIGGCKEWEQRNQIESQLKKIADGSMKGARWGVFLLQRFFQKFGRIKVALAFRGVSRITDAKISALAATSLGDTTKHLTFDKADNEDFLVGQGLANIKMKAGMYFAAKGTNGKPDRSVVLSQKLEETISQITGREFYFVVEPNPELSLKLVWGGTRMLLKQAPDGLRSILGWLAACVVKLDVLLPDSEDVLNESVILLLDEPELHLHPAWQRHVIPSLQRLLPNSQIIVATHSPFVISSVNEGWIHVLQANEDGVVSIDKAQPCGKGDSYLDATELVLGVTEFYDPETESLLDQFRVQRDAIVSKNEIGQLKTLEGLSAMIGSRGDSLNALMQREMAKLRRQLEAVN
jgi:energy-coupling factor transporter ATP-binding protein EcfA2